jgi:hypothetical protein
MSSRARKSDLNAANKALKVIFAPDNFRPDQDQDDIVPNT